MARKVFDAVAVVGKYTDSMGNEKKRYVNIGSVFEDDQGRMSLKVDTIPVGQGWSGWISFFATKERSPLSEHSEAKGNGFQPQPLDDDISF